MVGICGRTCKPVQMQRDVTSNVSGSVVEVRRARYQLRGRKEGRQDERKRTLTSLPPDLNDMPLPLLLPLDTDHPRSRVDPRPESEMIYISFEVGAVLLEGDVVGLIQGESEVGEGGDCRKRAEASVEDRRRRAER